MATVPDSNAWELFFMRMTVLCMAQEIAAAAYTIGDGLGDVTSTHIDQAAAAVNSFWTTIT